MKTTNYYLNAVKRVGNFVLAEVTQKGLMKEEQERRRFYVYKTDKEKTKAYSVEPLLTQKKTVNYLFANIDAIALPKTFDEAFTLLEKVSLPPMKITCIEQKLTDGSYVYDVLLNNFSGQVKIHCTTETAAYELEAFLNANTVGMTVEKGIEAVNTD